MSCRASKLVYLENMLGTEAAGGSREEQDLFCLGSPHIVGPHMMLVPMPLPSWVDGRLCAAVAVGP